MIPKRIIRFFYECFKYELLNKQLIEKIEDKYFDFDNFDKHDINMIKNIYLFVSNFPYVFNIINSEEKEKYLNKINKAKDLLKNNFSKSKIDQYKNKGDFNYLENMIENYIDFAKENKFNSELILDLSEINISDNSEKESEEEKEYRRNLGNLHNFLNHTFENEMPDKINLEVK